MITYMHQTEDYCIILSTNTAPYQIVSDAWWQRHREVVVLKNQTSCRGPDLISTPKKYEVETKTWSAFPPLPHASASPSARLPPRAPHGPAPSASHFPARSRPRANPLPPSIFFTKPYRSAATAAVHQPSPSSHRLRESPSRRPVPLNTLQPIHSHRHLTLFLCHASLYTPPQPWLDGARRQARVRAFEVLTLLPPSSRLPNRDATPHVATPPPDRCVSA
jgi:hypothetical protein